MSFCTKCGAILQASHQYCWSCGVKAEAAARAPGRPNPQLPVVDIQPCKPASSPAKLGQLFGLDPRIAILTLIVDMMLNAGDLVTMGMLLPVSIMAGAVLGYIVYKAQINWYGDAKESAKIKALILGLLTAISTPLPELLYIPAGIVGLDRKSVV